MRVLFLTQTDEVGASARYRVYQYLDFLKKNGVECVISPAVTDTILLRYTNRHNIFDKVSYYTSIILQRISDLSRIKNFDCVFLQRDVLIHAYPFIERIIATRQKNIIFDFDDALYLDPYLEKNKRFLWFIRDKSKIARLIKLSKHVIVGNNFLKKYASNFTADVSLIPTSIDLDIYKLDTNPRKASGKITIGWIGSQLTFPYLEQLFPVFIGLANKYNIKLKVVGANGPRAKGIDIEYKHWTLETELDDLYSFDIGVMPLTEDNWSRGKSGTKLLQYMAAGVSAVASPVGVNTEVIKDGINGFLADNNEAWVKKIAMLIENQQLRREIINNARRNIERYYSVQINAPRLLEVIKKVIFYSL